MFVPVLRLHNPKQANLNEVRYTVSTHSLWLVFANDFEYIECRPLSSNYYEVQRYTSWWFSRIQIASSRWVGMHIMYFKKN